MWIQRIAVANWRGLDFELDGLDPGLNLIAGPNESGKSRLVEALRFALFESTSGKAAHKKNLESWGVAPEKPQVTVAFELDGTTWHLEKVFLGTGCNTRLRGGTEELSGEEAEQRLCDLLEVAGGTGRTEVKVQDQGIWSLLWVDQGESQGEPVHNTDSQNRILGLLTEEIGEAAAGESGKRVLALAEAERNRYYTASTGKEKDTLTRPRENVAELEQRLAEAVVRRDALANAADELERARAAVQDLTTRHQEAQGELEDLRERHQQTEALRHDLELAEERARTAASTQQEAAQKVERLASEHEELASLAEVVTSGREALKEAETARDKAQAAFDAARQDHEAQQQSIESLEGRLRTLRRQEKLAAQQIDLERAATRLAEARKLGQRETEIRAELNALPRITAEDVTRLREAQDARNTAQATLQGAAVSVEVTALGDIEVEGARLKAGESQQFTIDEDRALTLRDVATIQVRPGGGEIVALRDEVRQAERRVAGLLEELGVADANAADDIVRRRERLEEELERQQETLAQQVPEGVPALEQAVAELRAAVEAATAQTADAEPFDAEALQRAESELEALNRNASEARARREAAQERLSEARTALATRDSDLKSKQDQQARLEQRLAEQPSLDALREQLKEAERSYRELIAARDAVRERFHASGGEGLAADLERAGKAEAQLGAQLSKQREEVIRLETTLDAGSDDGRHEQVLDLEADLTQAREALARVERQAAAARRLYEVLDREYRAARERLTQPVIERIRPYLQALFPGSEVWLDEELNLRGLRSESGQEAFEFLSGGAREQLSLLVRIGLAEVVGTGESWPLVLDDVLVNTDAERIRRMQRALFSAGQKMQILLFTCHGSLFDSLGPDAYIELPAPPVRASAPGRTEARPDEVGV